MQLNNTTAIVTGGASGLGAATATALVKAGATVFALDLTQAIDNAPAVGVLRIGVQSRLPVSAPCSTSPPAAFAEPGRTTTNETKTETTTVAVGSIRTHVRRPTVRILGGRHCPAGAGKTTPNVRSGHLAKALGLTVRFT